MEILLTCIAAGLVLLQIFLSLRKSWYIGLVLPGAALLAPFVLRGLEYTALPMARLFPFAALTALVLAGICALCRIYLHTASKDAEKFEEADEAEELAR